MLINQSLVDNHRLNVIVLLAVFARLVVTFVDANF